MTQGGLYVCGLTDSEESRCRRLFPQIFINNRVIPLYHKLKLNVKRMRTHFLVSNKEYIVYYTHIFV